MPEEQKTVFISYRRSVSSFIARAIFLDLRDNGYDVFMDVESIDNGMFDTIIFNQIAARAHFLVILTPGTIERCANLGDMMRREIEYAIDKQRNIVPLLINDFTFKGTEEYLTGKLDELPRFNGLNVPHDFFEEAMERLRRRYLKQPVYGVVMPAPASDQPSVQQKIEEIAAHLTPTAKELSAEDYFTKAMALNDNSDEEIAYYTEALSLNPLYAAAYNNRGAARRNKGDIEGAISDYSEAIRVKPDYGEAYNNRGKAHADKGDLEGAIADYSESIRIWNTLLANTNKGEFKLNIEELDFDIIVGEAYREARIRVKDRPLKVIVRDFEPVRIKGDGDRLKLLLSNLLISAIKFTPDGGQILINLSKTEHDAVLQVQDTGIGISPEDLQCVFDRFYNADASGAWIDSAEGAGLGLSIAHWIAQAHGGKIQVESTVGKGTTFTLTLPHIDEPEHVLSEAVTRPRLSIRRGIIPAKKIKP